MGVTLEAIKFNHDSASAKVDAFNIRRNEAEFVSVPEWRRGISIRPEDSPAAYAIRETFGNRITIQAKVKRVDPNIKKVEIRAVDPASKLMFSEIDYLIDSVFTLLCPFPRARNKNVLGRVEAKQVTFGDSDESDFESFDLKDVCIWSAGVSLSNTTWQWQYRLRPGDSWIDCQISRHRIYTVLAIPEDPWRQCPFDKENTQLPWAEVFEHACDWAYKARDFDRAAEKITHSVRRLEQTIDLTYQGSPFYSSRYDFYCTAFLQLLRDSQGKGGKLNCSDCATIVSSFANILGCALWQSTMVGTSMGDNLKYFVTNPVRLFGETCWGPSVFVGHEVAWKGDCSEDDVLFDACLQLDGDDNPTRWPHRPVLPANMSFGRFDDRQYLFRLIGPPNITGQGVRPNPRTKMRRRIGKPTLKRDCERLNPEIFGFVKTHYEYVSWRKPLSPGKNLLLKGTIEDITFAVRAGFTEWELVDDLEIHQPSDHRIMIQGLLRSKHHSKRSLARLDIDICKSSRAARYFLLQRLAEFQTPTLELRPDLDFGEVTFTEPNGPAVLFARANLAVSLRNARRSSLELIDAGRKFDRYLAA